MSTRRGVGDMTLEMCFCVWVEGVGCLVVWLDCGCRDGGGLSRGSKMMVFVFSCFLFGGRWVGVGIAFLFCM